MKVLPLLCAIAGLCTPAFGATIAWSGAADNGFALQGGTAMLPAGNLVRLGYFNISDSQIQQRATDVAYLNSNFVQLDFDRIGGPEVGNFPGYFTETEGGLNTGSTGLNITGKQLVMWAFASTDNSSVALSIQTATQIAILYMDKGVNSSWAVPGNTPDISIDGDTTIALTQLTGFGATADLVTGAKVLVGSFTANQAGAANGRNFALATVPEPSTVGALLGGTAILMWRRRRS